MINSFTPGTTILASQTNANNADFANGLSNVLTRDNQAPMTGPLRIVDGSQVLPGLQFANDTNTGLRRPAVDEMRAVTGGLDAMRWDVAQKTWALGAFDVAGAANFQAALTGLTAALVASGATPLTLRRSEDTLDEREVISIGVGDGSGAKASDRIVGDGSDDVVERRRYIGSTEIERLTTSLALMNILFGVGASIRLNPSGFLDLTEIAAPANPAANVARLYPVDVDGASRVAYRDSAGVVTLLGYQGELMAIIEDRKAQNTPGGTFTSGADQTRVLTTLVFSRNALVSLAANQFTLPAGDWEVEWSAPARQVDSHQTFLFNVTDATEIIRGSSELTNNSLGFVTRSVGSTRVSLAGSKAFEIRHRCSQTRATDGFGSPCNFATEVYTRVVVRRA